MRAIKFFYEVSSPLSCAVAGPITVYPFASISKSSVIFLLASFFWHLSSVIFPLSSLKEDVAFLRKAHELPKCMPHKAPVHILFFLYLFPKCLKFLVEAPKLKKRQTVWAVEETCGRRAGGQVGSRGEDQGEFGLDRNL